nr:uncharacterized protein LOC127315717 [Lolium perenne]
MAWPTGAAASRGRADGRRACRWANAWAAACAVRAEPAQRAVVMVRRLAAARAAAETKPRPRRAAMKAAAARAAAETKPRPRRVMMKAAAVKPCPEREAAMPAVLKAAAVTMMRKGPELEPALINRGSGCLASRHVRGQLDAAWRMAAPGRAGHGAPDPGDGAIAAPGDRMPQPDLERTSRPGPRRSCGSRMGRGEPGVGPAAGSQESARPRAEAGSSPQKGSSRKPAQVRKGESAQEGRTRTGRGAHSRKPAQAPSLLLLSSFLHIF